MSDPDCTPIRVLVVSQGFPRHPDDHHANFVLDHARALVDAGCEVEVSCPAGPNLPHHDAYNVGPAHARTIGVHRFRYAPRRFETLAYSGAMHHQARGLKALLVPLFAIGMLVAVVRRARNADVIHAHWWVPSGLIAAIASRITKTPFVVHLHGTDVALARGPVRVLARSVLRRADAVLAVSGALADWVTNTTGVEAQVLPMPLRRSLATVERTPPPSDGPIVAVGRLVPEKGFDVLVRAAARAGVTVEVIGTGAELADLRALAHELGADVTFLGAVPPEEVASHYLRARLVAVPSRREGFGLVAAEALACGRAVVASAVGGLESVVTDGLTGHLVPAGNPVALANALVNANVDLGRNGPDSVAWLSADTIAAATTSIYRSILGA